MTFVDLIGTVGGTLSTLCWLPQVRKVLIEKDTHSISLPTFVVLAIGVACWIVYGIGAGDFIVIGANAVSLCFILAILTAKLRYG
jgi:MtN3 and saliva related transmembrane protein